MVKKEEKLHKERKSKIAKYLHLESYGGCSQTTVGKWVDKNVNLRSNVRYKTA